MLAFNKATGQLVWSTQADSHPAAIITQSPTVFNGRVYVGVASQEEALAAFVPGLRAVVPRQHARARPGNRRDPVEDLHGAGPGLHRQRDLGQLAGHRHQARPGATSPPATTTRCHSRARLRRRSGRRPGAQAACLPADDYFDSIMALDMTHRARSVGDPGHSLRRVDRRLHPVLRRRRPLPRPGRTRLRLRSGARAVHRSRTADGKPVEVVGAGQKSGQYWALDADTGAVRWVTQAGPGGTAGGLQWGSAVDGTRVYTANANSNLVPWTLPGGAVTTNGVWSGLDAATGAVLWQTHPAARRGHLRSGDDRQRRRVRLLPRPRGHMYALNGATGAVCGSSPAAARACPAPRSPTAPLYWGSGYSNFGFGTPNNKLYAFGLPG